MQYLGLILCLYQQSLTDCQVPLSQGPSYVWKVTGNHNNCWSRVDKDESKEWVEFEINSTLEVVLSSSVSD